MDAPPKIADGPAKVIPLEFVGPTPPTDNASPDGMPIHALSALILVAVDGLWTIFDFAPPLWIIAIPLCFMATFVPAFLIQKVLKRDSIGRAFAIATVLGVLAAVPTPITGTSVGLGILAWSGLGKLLGKKAR